MTALLLQIGATKLALSIVVAGAVWVVHRTVDRPSVSYLLWLTVLVTLLVPAVVSVPVLPAEPTVGGIASHARDVPAAAAVDPAMDAAAVEFARVTADPALGRRPGAFPQSVLAVLWLVGTATLVGWTAVRTIRFRRTLKRALRPAPAWLRRRAESVGRDLGLTRIPELRTTNARVTPMVWGSGARARLLIPSFLLTDPGGEELRAILAHELAHVRRRDHLVRWLEWLACSVFWWNPVAWWARHRLRIAEESCCDRLVVGAARSCPRVYARALLRVVANASGPPGFRPPPPTSAAGGAGQTKSLERRIRMIVSTDTRPPAPRWLRTTGRLAVVCALPLGLVYCDRRMAPERAAADGPEEVAAVVDEFLESVSRRGLEIQERIRDEVESGALSEERARELSAHVTGAATELLIRHTLDHEISEDEVRAASSRVIEDLSLRAALVDLLANIRDVVDHTELSARLLNQLEELNARYTELTARIQF